MCATNVGQDVAPVIVVLDEITLGKPNAVTGGLVHSDSRNREVPGFTEESLNAVLCEGYFIERCGAERVFPIHL